jgi:hypothetical protein
MNLHISKIIQEESNLKNQVQIKPKKDKLRSMTTTQKS